MRLRSVFIIYFASLSMRIAVACRTHVCLSNEWCGNSLINSTQFITTERIQFLFHLLRVVVCAYCVVGGRCKLALETGCKPASELMHFSTYQSIALWPLAPFIHGIMVFTVSSLNLKNNEIRFWSKTVMCVHCVCLRRTMHQISLVWLLHCSAVPQIAQRRCQMSEFLVLPITMLTRAPESGLESVRSNGTRKFVQ